MDVFPYFCILVLFHLQAEKVMIVKRYNNSPCYDIAATLHTQKHRVKQKLGKLYDLYSNFVMLLNCSPNMGG